MSKIPVGCLVQVEIDGQIVFFGIAEYITRDGYVGIRQPGGRLDEAHLTEGL